MSLTLQAQIFDPVTWEFGYEKERSGNYELIITAFIRRIHIYSMDNSEVDSSPTSTTINQIILNRREAMRLQRLRKCLMKLSASR